MSEVDCALFEAKNQGQFVYIILFVDDGIILSENMNVIDKVLNLLKKGL